MTVLSMADILVHRHAIMESTLLARSAPFCDLLDSVLAFLDERTWLMLAATSRAAWVAVTGTVFEHRRDPQDPAKVPSLASRPTTLAEHRWKAKAVMLWPELGALHGCHVAIC